MVQVIRQVDVFTGEVKFVEPHKSLLFDYRLREMVRSYEEFVYGGAVGHTFRGGTYRLDGTPLPY